MAAVNNGGKLMLTQATVLEIRNGSPLKRGPTLAAREADRARGEVASEAFARFAKGAELVDVVREMHQDPDVVERLWTRWVALQETQRKSIVLTCHHEHRGGECDGPPLASVSMCRHHASRARHLTDEQAAILAGREVPTAVHCTACDMMASRGVCSSCVSAVTIVVEGAGTGRRLVVRAGQKVIAIVAADKSRKLARELIESDPPPIVVTTPDPSMPVVSAADILAHLQLEIEAERTDE